MNKHFSKKGIWMARRHMQKCSSSLINANQNNKEISHISEKGIYWKNWKQPLFYCMNQKRNSGVPSGSAVMDYSMRIPQKCRKELLYAQHLFHKHTHISPKICMQIYVQCSTEYNIQGIKVTKYSKIND